MFLLALELYLCRKPAADTQPAADTPPVAGDMNGGMGGDTGGGVGGVIGEGEGRRQLAECNTCR